MWRPMSAPASPSASHSAGENGLMKVPTMFPMVSAYTLCAGSTPSGVVISSTTGSSPK